MPDASTCFSWVDIGLLVALLAGLGMGAFRGLSHEAAVFASFFLAVLFTRLAYIPLADWLAEQTGWDLQILRLVSLLLLLGISIGAMKLARVALGAMMSFAFKGWLERLGGAIAGGVRYGIIYSLVILALGFLSVPGIENSWTARRILPFFRGFPQLLTDPSGVEDYPPPPPPGAELGWSGTSAADWSDVPGNVLEDFR